MRRASDSKIKSKHDQDFSSDDDSENDDVSERQISRRKVRTSIYFVRGDLYEE